MSCVVHNLLPTLSIDTSSLFVPDKTPLNLELLQKQILWTVYWPCLEGLSSNGHTPKDLTMFRNL
jgi:hypothetical protein